MSWFSRRRKSEATSSSAYAAAPATSAVAANAAGAAATPPAPGQTISAGTPVTPLSKDRLTRLIESRGWKCQIDDDGDLTGRWDDDLVSFMLRGEQEEMLNVMGLMLEDVPMSKLDEARFAIDEWHREHLWPVCFWRENDDAGLTFTIGAAVAVDWEPGATDKQLLQHLECGLATCGQAFADFRERLALEPYVEPGP
ncbi:Uncharacterised protein [Actinomyces bovis]|uniref:Bacterial sensory transduction regulator n=1 Tax=Actinomyces bovis TaxID=1658 RepID=A0ABY1VRM5_9ACTO|nr:YbjN domain-containing protein [Actinomyces bovis]SPT54072.1 Uncharacterised protein [Actinomyces bovis]VEG53734.1 Uncharacterised protein [Actinomyces israelii]